MYLCIHILYICAYVDRHIHTNIMGPFLTIMGLLYHDLWLHTYVRTYIHTYVDRDIRTSWVYYIMIYGYMYVCIYVRTYVDRHIHHGSLSHYHGSAISRS